MERLASSQEFGVAKQGMAVADCNEKTVTMEISRPKAIMAHENRALYVVGTVGGALCAEVLEYLKC
jgi:hypothetical protein